MIGFVEQGKQIGPFRRRRHRSMVAAEISVLSPPCLRAMHAQAVRYSKADAARGSHCRNASATSPLVAPMRVGSLLAASPLVSNSEQPTCPASGPDGSGGQDNCRGTTRRCRPRHRRRSSRSMPVEGAESRTRRPTRLRKPATCRAKLRKSKIFLLDGVEIEVVGAHIAPSHLRDFVPDTSSPISTKTRAFASAPRHRSARHALGSGAFGQVLLPDRLALRPQLSAYPSPEIRPSVKRGRKKV